MRLRARRATRRAQTGRTPAEPHTASIIMPYTELDALRFALDGYHQAVAAEQATLARVHAAVIATILATRLPDTQPLPIKPSPTVRGDTGKAGNTGRND